MQTVTLAEIERAIRGAWCAETSFIRKTAPPWHADNPSRGQCGTTSLVLQDLLVGELLVAGVTDNGEPDGVHYWNRFGTLDVDLTREQFGPEHAIGEPKVVTRPPEGPRKGVQQYELLRTKVFSELGIESDGSGLSPILTIMPHISDIDGR